MGCSSQDGGTKESGQAGVESWFSLPLTRAMPQSQSVSILGILLSPRATLWHSLSSERRHTGQRCWCASLGSVSGRHWREMPSGSLFLHFLPSPLIAAPTTACGGGVSLLGYHFSNVSYSCLSLKGSSGCAFFPVPMGLSTFL